MTTTGFPTSSGSDSSTLLTSCFDWRKTPSQIGNAADDTRNPGVKEEKEWKEQNALRQKKHAIIIRSSNNNTRKEIEAGRELTDGRKGGDDPAEFELIKDGRLTGVIETDHENVHFSLGKQLLKKLGECEPHFCKKS
ncbi:unnamed protein product [Sphagnum jensenii]|uniref:Uncharacterized protein n=1 Tax=Sphagnum jensenii TaxID=128206 RepID=A0ABP1BJ87_9BRYO